MLQMKQALDTVSLIKQFQQKNDLSARNAIVEKYMNLVHIITNKTVQSIYVHYDKDDLINEGMIGLIDAISKFDMKSDVKFETYASIRIRGAIIDFMRRQDMVPRRVRKNSRDIQNTFLQLYTKNGREPSELEVMAHIGMTQKEYKEAQVVMAQSNPVSMEALVSDDGLNFSAQRDKPNLSEDEVEKKELVQSLSGEIKKLNEREQMIISLYYVDEIKLRDISKLLKISESRVCQIHTQVLKKLKIKLEDYA